jgi:hypothetical protein
MYARNFKIFLKLGAGIPANVRARIKEDFLDLMAEALLLHDEPVKYTTSDGISYRFSTAEGSSWGGFGYSKSS